LTGLRRATADDAGKLALIGAASFLETFANDHPGDATVEFIRAYHSESAWAATLAKPDTVVWIVEEAAGCPVGYAVLSNGSLPGTTPDDAELKRIYVLSRWHGTGIGRDLFEVVEAEARTRRAARMVLSVYTRNARAIRFYEKQGFAVIGDAMFAEFPVAFSDKVMAKAL
jgi:diamine N-acetyltransferase